MLIRGRHRGVAGRCRGDVCRSARHVWAVFYKNHTETRDFDSADFDTDSVSASEEILDHARDSLERLSCFAARRSQVEFFQQNRQSDNKKHGVRGWTNYLTWCGLCFQLNDEKEYVKCVLSEFCVQVILHWSHIPVFYSIYTVRIISIWVNVPRTCLLFWSFPSSFFYLIDSCNRGLED